VEERRLARRAGSWAVCAHAFLLLFCAAAAAQGAGAPNPGAPSRGVAVLLPRSEGIPESVAEGLGEWMVERLRAAGLEVADRERVRSTVLAIAPGGARPEDAPALGQRAGVPLVLFSHVLAQPGGAVEFRLRLRQTGDATVVAAASEAGRLDEIGTLARDALAMLLARLDLPTAVVVQAPPPRLSELGSYGRSIAELRASNLVAAWRELSGLITTTADGLRGEIATRSEAREVSVAQRSRLANLSGQQDRDWLRVRDALRQGGDEETFLAAADAAVARSKPEQALGFFEKAAALAPQSLDAQIGWGDALLQAGQAEAAHHAFERAAALRPDDPRVPERLARLNVLPAAERAARFLEAGDLRAARFEVDDARRSYEEVRGLDPALAPVAARRLGRLFERLGDARQAATAYEEALAGGALPEVLIGLGRSRAELGELGRAEAHLRAALGMAPDDPAAHAALGDLLARSSRFAEAAGHLERAVTARPDDVTLRRSLAAALSRSSRTQQALAVLEAAGPSVPGRSGLLEDAAALHRAEGRLSDAERVLREAIRLDPDSPSLRKALAEVYSALGDEARSAEQRGALVALERASEGLSPTVAEQSDDQVSSFSEMIASLPRFNSVSGDAIGAVLLLPFDEQIDRTERVRRWVFPRRSDLAPLEIELMRGIAGRYQLEETPAIPPSLQAPVAALRGGSTDPETIATVNDFLGVDAVFVARLVPAADGGSLFGARDLRVEVQLLGGRQAEKTFQVAHSVVLEGARSRFLAWNGQAFLNYAILLVLLALPFLRGWGTLVVTLDAEGSRGFFTLKLTRRQQKPSQDVLRRGSPSHAWRFQMQVKFLSRFTRQMVGRETRFRMIPAGSWYVGLHGLLQAPDTGEPIGSYFEEKRLRLGRGEVRHVRFDPRRKEATLEVRLATPEGEPLQTAALVGLRGGSSPPRYVTADSTALFVGNGNHVVVVGWRDRILEREVSVENFHGATLIFQLGADDDAVFTGCPEAVEAYANNNLLAAAQALDVAGQPERASLVRAKYHWGRGEAEEALRYYEAAGRLLEAAELSRAAGDAARAAPLFEQAGDFEAAAVQWRKAGELTRAGTAYERAWDQEAAIECFREAGELHRVVALLERAGRYFDAAGVAMEALDADSAIRNLQRIEARDPLYSEALRTLSEILAQRGELGLAVQKMEQAIAASGESDAPLELFEQYATLLEKAGKLEAACATWESVRKRDFHYPNAAERLESLRRKLSEAASRREEESAEPVTVAAGERRYEILGELGRGGMGVVCKARDLRLGRVVALKRLPENLRENPTAVQLFLREARAAAALNHQNIVTLFDVGQDEDSYYITMECLEGLSLDQILKRSGRLSARDVVRLGVQIATGLQYAHERRIVHRDIKTSNLFFTRDKKVKIMDFGLAKMTDELRRGTTMIGGTPYYMSPEQALGTNVDHRSDLYSLGVTFYELLTGSVPFKTGNVAWHHQRTPAPDPRLAVKDVPDALAELILQLLAKRPEDRPVTTAEVTQRLAEIYQRISR
jgi:tetratricopeptide (TPR) repeat protein